MAALRGKGISVLRCGFMGRKGEEVTWSYSAAAALRADRALLSYFFLDRDQQPPLLASLDLPGGSFLDGAQEPPDDAQHAPGGRFCTQARLRSTCTCASLATLPCAPSACALACVFLMMERGMICLGLQVLSHTRALRCCSARAQEEAQRLQAILDGFPTSEAQDRALLEGGKTLDWRERTVVEFRVARKEALRRTLDGLRAATQQPPSGERRAPVQPRAGAIDRLQEPVFIQVGSHAGDDL